MFNFTSSIQQKGVKKKIGIIICKENIKHK